MTSTPASEPNGETAIVPGRRTRSSLLNSLAWLNVVAHLAAVVFAAMAISPGNPVTELPARMHYLARAPWGWTLGWGCWMLSALALVAFFAALANRLPRHDALANLAVILASAGAAMDLFCDMTQLSVLPMAAQGGEASKVLFLVVERIVGIGGMVVANGFYSVGVLLLSVGLRVCGPRARWAIWLGYCVFGFGMLLVLAGLIDHAWLAATAGVQTILVYCVWVVVVARVLDQHGAAP
jgi:hypothetical protein